MKSLDEIVWPQIYRPRTLDDCILPKHFRAMFEQFLEDGKIPDLLLYSRCPGVGKTTVARILCEALGYDYIEVNGSDENGIDALRGKIQSHASTESIDGDRKCVIIDEADGITHQAQNAFKGFIEKYSSNCTFIFTCNQLNKIQRPIQSRLAPINFDFNPNDKKDLMVQMMKRAEFILSAEGVEYDKIALAKIISINYPEFRAIIALLQKLSKLGKIQKVEENEDDYSEMLSLLRNKEWTKLRNWTAENYTLGFYNILAVLSKNESKLVFGKDQMAFSEYLSDYAVRYETVALDEIHLAALFSTIIATCNFIDE